MKSSSKSRDIRKRRSRLLLHDGSIRKESSETEEESSSSCSQVSFGSIETIEIPMILGDHPECKYGPAVTLSWDVQERNRMDIDEYEANRPRRRSSKEFRLSSVDRRRMYVFNLFVCRLEVYAVSPSTTCPLT